MADEETVVEGLDDDEEGSEPKKKAGPNLILLGGIGIGAIVIGIVLALFVIGPMMSSDGSEGVSKTETAEEAGESHGGTQEPSKDHKKKESHGKHSSSLMYTIEDIVVNPAGTGGSRYLSTSIGFELGSEELAAKFSERDPIVRDALITILASKTVAQLTDAKQKEITRYQIKKRVSKLMNTENLVGVYYTDFVLQ